MQGQFDILFMESVMLQLETMAQTSILITPCGGTGTVLTFLPPGSTAIVFNYWQDLRNVSVQMESIYYWLVASWHHPVTQVSMSAMTSLDCCTQARVSSHVFLRVPICHALSLTNCAWLLHNPNVFLYLLARHLIRSLETIRGIQAYKLQQDGMSHCLLISRCVWQACHQAGLF